MSADVRPQNCGTRPVAPEHRFDHARLGSWLRERVEGFDADRRIDQLNGGQSIPTFRLTSAGRRYALRRKPPGVLLPSAHAVEREYQVIRALAGTEVPVARAHVLCEGHASNARAVDAGRRTRPLAEQAWALAPQIDALR